MIASSLSSTLTSSLLSPGRSARTTNCPSRSVTSIWGDHSAICAKPRGVTPRANPKSSKRRSMSSPNRRMKLKGLAQTAGAKFSRRDEPVCSPLVCWRDSCSFLVPCGFECFVVSWFSFPLAMISPFLIKPNGADKRSSSALNYHGG